MIRPPTPAQSRVLVHLARWLELSGGLSPSFRQLTAFMGGRAVRTTAEHVHYLRAKGCVTHVPGRSHTLHLTEAGRTYAKADAPTLDAEATRARFAELARVP